MDVPTGSSISVSESRNEGKPSENLAVITIKWIRGESKEMCLPLLFQKICHVYVASEEEL